MNKTTNLKDEENKNVNLENTGFVENDNANKTYTIDEIYKEYKGLIDSNIDNLENGNVELVRQKILEFVKKFIVRTYMPHKEKEDFINRHIEAWITPSLENGRRILIDRCNVEYTLVTALLDYYTNIQIYIDNDPEYNNPHKVYDVLLQTNIIKPIIQNIGEDWDRIVSFYYERLNATVIHFNAIWEKSQPDVITSFLEKLEQGNVMQEALFEVEKKKIEELDNDKVDKLIEILSNLSANDTTKETVAKVLVSDNVVPIKNNNENKVI
jgi:hypothetical protein